LSSRSAARQLSKSNSVRATTFVAASLGFLVSGWLVYDLICRAFGQRKNGDLIVAGGVLALVIAASSTRFTAGAPNSAGCTTPTSRS